MKRCPANWKTRGRSAWPIINEQMSNNADALAPFLGRRRAASMKCEATSRGPRVFEVAIVSMKEALQPMRCSAPILPEPWAGLYRQALWNHEFKWDFLIGN